MYNKIILLVCLFFSSIYPQASMRFETGKSTLQDIYFTEMETSYKFKIPIKNNDLVFQSYGSFLSWETFNTSNYEFDPIEITFKIGQKINWNHTFIKFEHYCNHPVINKATAILNEKNEKVFDYFNPSPYW